MPDDLPCALLAYIVGEWQQLRPLTDAPPPRGVWILAHEPVAGDIRDGITTPVTSAWYGTNDGIQERAIASVQLLRANVGAWQGRPYHRWGWVDIAPIVDEPVYYLECVWGGLFGYGLQAAVTTRGLVLTSAHLWQA